MPSKAFTRRIWRLEKTRLKTVIILIDLDVLLTAMVPASRSPLQDSASDRHLAWWLAPPMMMTMVAVGTLFSNHTLDNEQLEKTKDKDGS